MADNPRIILELARDGAVDRQLSEDPPQSVASGEVVIEHGPADSYGHLEAGGPGQIVLSVPSPEGLAREPDEVHRLIAQAGTGVEPLVIVVEAAAELRDDELAVVVEAAGHTSRPVILRVMGEA